MIYSINPIGKRFFKRRNYKTFHATKEAVLDSSNATIPDFRRSRSLLSFSRIVASNESERSDFQRVITTSHDVITYYFEQQGNSGNTFEKDCWFWKHVWEDRFLFPFLACRMAEKKLFDSNSRLKILRLSIFFGSRIFFLYR